MRPAPFLFPVLVACALSACNGPSPLAGLAALTDPAESDRRGAVELAVKGGFPAILDDIAAGGGPRLTAAFDAARVPVEERPTRLIQLEADRGLYEANPGALALALFTYGS